MPNDSAHFLGRPLTWGFCLSLVLHGLAVIFVWLLVTPTRHEMITVDFMRATPVTAPTPAAAAPALAPKPLRVAALPRTQNLVPAEIPQADPLPSSSSVVGNASQTMTTSGTASYLGELRAKIEALKQYPAMARNRGQTGKAEVAFTVLKTGEITNIHLVAKTPFETLNNAALAAVAGIRQFKPIPDELARNEWEIQIPIVFKID